MLEPRSAPLLTEPQLDWMIYYRDIARGKKLGRVAPDENSAHLKKIGLIYENPQGNYEATQFGLNVIDQLEFEAREK